MSKPAKELASDPRDAGQEHNLTDHYEVGYRKPPAEHRFRKGQSGNLKGRPRGSKNTVPKGQGLDFGTQPANQMLLEEAYRTVAVREGDKVIELPVIKAVFRSMGVSAMKGNRLAQATMAELVRGVEEEDRQLRTSHFAAAWWQTAYATQEALDTELGVVRRMVYELLERAAHFLRISHEAFCTHGCLLIWGRSMSYIPLTSLRLIAADTRLASESSEDRRCHQRLRTVYRVARVATEGDEGLARVLNISDGGMLLSLSVEVQVGDKIRVDLAERSSFSAHVVWRDGGHCGVSLSEPIDSAHTLRALGAQHNLPWRRPLRLSLKKPLVVSSEVGLHRAALRDVSQGGCKVIHDGRFRAGLAVKVTLGAGVERRGVVRWLNENEAGIQLTDLLTVEELGSMRGL